MHGKEQEDSKYGSDPQQQQGCKYISELDHSSSALIDDSMDRYGYQVYGHYSDRVEYTITNDGLDNYIFLADHNQCVSNIASPLSYDHIYEKGVATAQHLNADIGIKFPFFNYDEFKEHKKGYQLQEENEVEDIYTNHMHKETFQQNSDLMVQEFEVSFDRNKTSNVHVLFQEDYGTMNETKIVDEPYGLLYQLKLCHVFQDLVAIYMDSEVSKGFSLLVFEFKVEYALPINFML